MFRHTRPRDEGGTVLSEEEKLGQLSQESNQGNSNIVVLAVSQSGKLTCVHSLIYSFSLSHRACTSSSDNLFVLENCGIHKLTTSLVLLVLILFINIKILYIDSYNIKKHAI